MEQAAKQREYENRRPDSETKIKALEALSLSATRMPTSAGGVLHRSERRTGQAGRDPGPRPDARSIEGIDIANLHGEESCGSLVSFIDASRLRAAYKRFRNQDGSRASTTTP